MNKKLVALLLLAVALFTPKISSAQNLDLTYTYDLSDNQAISGDVIASSDKGLVRADTSYTPKIFGILLKEPTVVYKSLDDTQQSIARAGVAIVNVTNLNGEIKKGDYITSSPIVGKGQKSTQSGYSIGVALSDFDGSAGEKVNFDSKQYTSGQVQVALRIEFTELSNPRSVARLLDFFNIALFQNLQDSRKSIELVKYLAALIVVVASIVLGFLVFARSVPKSIEALGRNPLAKNAIQFSIILSILLTVLTSLLGIGAAYLILRI